MGGSPPLTHRLKLAFAFGSTAESVIFTTTSGLLLIYYNQVRGAPAGLVGLALSFGLVVNAIFEPVVGSWSDRTRSRLGRRHPFMFASIAPVVIGAFAIFNPPAGLSQTAEIIWLGVTNVILMQAITAFHTPHLAFGGELSDDYIERSSVMSYNMFFLWLGDSASWLMTFAIFFPATAAYPNGALNPEPWGRFSLTIAAIALVALFVSSWFTRSRIPFLPQASPDAPRFSVHEFMRDILRVMSNRNYVMLLIGFFFVSLMSGVRNALWLYGATFFWQLSTAQVAYFVIGSLFGYVFGSGALTWLHRRFDKRWTAATALLVYCIGPALPLALGYLGILTPATPGLLVILIAFSILQHAPYSIVTSTTYSALADIADENDLKFGIRQEGIIYSLRRFFAKVDQAVGTALAGWVLTLIAFPAKATPGEVPESVLMALAAAFVLSTIPGLVATIFYAMLRVTRDSHARTRAALEARGSGC